MAAQEYYQSFRPHGQTSTLSPQRPPYPVSPGPSSYNPSPYLQPTAQSYTPQGATPPQYGRPRPQQQYSSYPFPQGPSQPSPQYASHSLLALPPLQPSRSRSEPAESSRLSLYHDRRHNHHHYSHRHSRSRSRSRHSHQSRRHSRSSSRSDSRRRSGSHSHSHKDHKDHKDRDTFLGAGGGALVGDALFPGLGTLGGALFGGWGGRNYGKSRSKSDSGYRDGITVKSGWIRR
ncbi:hypothetical protein EJ08DRAFT_645928 [Tothia fuscella]|uniref:Uncharacterized protein n=1 Tax=Tothia fuscella TaxID=1048955 RepID=A0A9P4P139_9PEZI|nr:hypothetical protein EJ08DRAFT_645928 [Tothia fuscella]